jgi:phosphoglycolate phosphatase
MRLIVFDLDGTLVDSAADITAAANRLLRRHGLPPLSEAAVKSMVGDGVEPLVRRLFAAHGREPPPGAVAAYTAEYEAHAAVHTRPFPGVAEALARLKAAGWRIAVCTNKPERAARSLLWALGLLGRIAAVGGGDSFPVRKPDPGHLRATVAAAGGTPERSLMVGDHANDVAAAAVCGMPCANSPTS